MTQATIVDVSPITRAYHPFVLGLLANAKAHREHQAEFTSKMFFLWQGDAFAARVVAIPSNRVGVYNLTITFNGSKELTFLETHKTELLDQLTALLRTGDGDGQWDVWDTPGSNRDALWLTVSTPGV